MFGRAKPYNDPTVGMLTRSRGRWRGTIDLGSQRSIPLSVPGSRTQPDASALALARTIPNEYDRSRRTIALALEEHRTAALEGGGSTEPGNEPVPSSAAVIQLDRSLTIQLAYRVDWDDDHTLGACVRGGELVELNGSILEP